MMASYVLKGKQAEGAFMQKPTYGIIPVLALAALGLTLGACQQSPAPAPVVNVEPSNNSQPASSQPSSSSSSVEHSATTSSSTTTDPHDPNAPASTTTSTESKMSKKTTQ
jgi:hypothetical protein